MPAATATALAQPKGRAAEQEAGSYLATAAARKVHAEVVARLTPFAATANGRDALRRMSFLASPAEATRAAESVMADKAVAAALDRVHVRSLLGRVQPAAEPPARQHPGRLVVCETEEMRESWEKRGLHRHVRLSGPEGLHQADDYDLVVFLYDEGREVDVESLAELPADAPWAEVDRLVRERTAGVVLSGADVLEAIGRRLPAALQKAVDAALADGARLLHERTGCSFQPYLAGSPVQVDDDEVEAMERTIQARGHLDAFQRLGRAAKSLASLRPAIDAELAAWQEFEVGFALGSFAVHHDLHPARFGQGLRFDASVHLDLAATETAQRIAYRLGEDEPVALLTGANSGGKTTLLEHILQIMLMSRMGLPVVGEDVEVPWVDEVHYVTARRSLDAGAFESFLKAFLPVALGDRRRLVLADEVEAVTEAEAASRILGCFLDRLHGSGSLAVVVSHMAPQILAHTRAPVRVDGIEATGLDARNRLVVDRNPRLGKLARSTPELIVQRLAATAKGPARELFEELLGRFQVPPPALRRRPARDMHK